MAYFLRFTNTENDDLSRGTSLLNLPSLSKPEILPGLCGYSFCKDEDIEYNIMSESEIESLVNDYKSNSWYNGKAVLFKGEYIQDNCNGEGVIFKPESIYKIY